MKSSLAFLASCAVLAQTEASTRICTNDCQYAYDGDCDDGGIGSDYTLCTFGNDCEDCGTRVRGYEETMPRFSERAMLTWGLYSRTTQDDDASLYSYSPTQIVDVNGDGLPDYVANTEDWERMPNGDLNKPDPTTLALLNDGCRFITQDEYDNSCEFPPCYCEVYYSQGLGSLSETQISAMREVDEAACGPQPDKLTAEGVVKWLRGIGLDQFAPHFTEHSISGGTMQRLESLENGEASLGEIGISPAIYQSKILGEWVNLRDEHARCLEDNHMALIKAPRKEAIARAEVSNEGTLVPGAADVPVLRSIVEKARKEKTLKKAAAQKK